MSGSLNKVTLIGNLAKDPDIRAKQDGKMVANLVLATNETWKDKATGEKKERVEWHRISCFNEGLVNVIKNYVKKGSKLYIEGQLQTRKWKDQNGQDKYSTEVVLQGYNCTLTMLDKPNNDYNQDGGHNEAEESQDIGNQELNDEVPF
jgi:single-strand DNA-binding protein